MGKLKKLLLKFLFKDAIPLNQEELEDEVLKYARKLNSFTDDELCRIYDFLDEWKWNPLLGDKPKDWNSMPKFYKSIFKEKHLKTKSHITDPIICAITHKVGNHKILKWHCTHNLGKTAEEYEDWIAERKALLCVHSGY